MADELNPENEITEITFDFAGSHLALCHKTQGFSANNKPRPILIKSTEEEVTKEALEALEKITGDVDAEVRIDTSMFDFLRKWMDMFWSDADMLSRILGFAGDGFDADSFIESQMEGITLLKNASNNQVPFKALKSDINKLSDFMKAHDLTPDSFSEGDPEMKVDVDLDDKSNTSNPSEKTNINQGNLMADKKTDQEKELEKALARLDALEKAAAKSDEEKTELASKVANFEKANQDRLEKAFISKVATYSFITEEEREDFAKELLKVDSEAIVIALDKAQAALKALTQTQGVDGEVVNLSTATKGSSRVRDMVMKQHGLTDVSK